MDGTISMDFVNRSSKLGAKLNCDSFRKRPVLPNVVGQRSTLKQRHNEKRPSVDKTAFVDIDDPLKLPESARLFAFALEPCDIGDTYIDDLNCYISLKRRLPTGVHSAVSAATLNSPYRYAVDVRYVSALRCRAVRLIHPSNARLGRAVNVYAPVSGVRRFGCRVRAKVWRFVQR